MLFRSGGILLIQIAVGSLYMFSVPRGYTDGFIQWCTQIIGLCLSAFLQATILVAGLMAVSYTHLDVYKRQVDICLRFNPDILVVGEMRGAEANTAQEAARVGVAAVSYTHLRKACWQLTLDSLLDGNSDTRYELMHEPTHAIKTPTKEK